MWAGCAVTAASCDASHSKYKQGSKDARSRPASTQRSHLDHNKTAIVVHTQSALEQAAAPCIDHKIVWIMCQRHVSCGTACTPRESSSSVLAPQPPPRASLTQAVLVGHAAEVRQHL